MSHRRKNEENKAKIDLSAAMAREKRRNLIIGIAIGAMAIGAVGAIVYYYYPTANPVAVIETNYGNITVELYQKEAPITVENFIKYADEGFYNGTIFHRVIDGFVIQGGGLTEAMVEKETHDPIKNEAGNGLKNDIYTIAMARTNELDSATSQFYINLKNNTNLNHKNDTQSGYGYCVFGKVIDGQDVVDKIAKMETHTVDQYDDVPIYSIVIQNVRIIR